MNSIPTEAGNKSQKKTVNKALYCDQKLNIHIYLQYTISFCSEKPASIGYLTKICSGKMGSEQGREQTGRAGRI